MISGIKSSKKEYSNSGFGGVVLNRAWLAVSSPSVHQQHSVGRCEECSQKSIFSQQKKKLTCLHENRVCKLTLYFQFPIKNTHTWLKNRQLSHQLTLKTVSLALVQSLFTWHSIALAQLSLSYNVVAIAKLISTTLSFSFILAILVKKLHIYNHILHTHRIQSGMFVLYCRCE